MKHRGPQKMAGCGTEGITLVELMVVMIIIAVIAAIATSSAIRAKVQADEGAVRGALKTIQSAAISYRTAAGAYPDSLATLGSDYLGGGLESGTKSGYNFTLVAGNSNESYTVTAVPTAAGFTGSNGFCTDAFNVIYVYSTPSSLRGDGASCPSGGEVFQA